MPTKDYYSILGVERAATTDDIKRAYRKLARTHHPDVADDKHDAEHRFKDINEAYGVLSDPNKRARYDRFGEPDGAANGADFGFGGFGPSGFGDIFDMFFGEAAPRSRANASAPRRGEDLRYDLQISLEEAFSGTTRDVQYRHLAACGSCKGSGAEPGSMVLPCDRCGGTGMARTVRQTPLGQFVTQSECSQCGGEGHVITKSCHECLGRGRLEADRLLTVKIPAGVDDGSRIRIAGSGHAGTLGGPPGDLYAYVAVAPHALFRREGTDTFVDLAIELSASRPGCGDIGPVARRRCAVYGRFRNADGHARAYARARHAERPRFGTRRPPRHAARCGAFETQQEAARDARGVCESRRRRHRRSVIFRAREGRVQARLAAWR